MKEKSVKIVSCFLLITILLCLIHYTGRLLNPKWTDLQMKAVEAFHYLPENSMEVLVYGSSHAFKGVDTRVMQEKYGIKAYNYAGNWQSINTTSLFIKDSFRTQSPKIILIETYNVGAVLQDTDLNGEIYYTKAIDMFKGKKEYLRQCFGENKERWLSYYFPLIMFHSNWNNIDYENFSDGGEIEQHIKSFGYQRNNIETPVSIGNYKEFEQYDLNENSIAILNDIVNVCKENDVKIVFFTVPYEGEYGWYEFMEKYASENNCVYLNLFENMEEVGLEELTDFRDGGHLNNNGAAKVADYLSKYIIENYEGITHS